MISDSEKFVDMFIQAINNLKQLALDKPHLVGKMSYDQALKTLQFINGLRPKENETDAANAKRILEGFQKLIQEALTEIDFRS